MASTADGQTPASGSADRTFWVWDVATGEQRLHPPQVAAVRSMVMTPDGKVLVTCGEREGLIRVRDARTGEGLATISSWGGCLAVSPDGKTPVRGRTGSG